MEDSLKFRLEKLGEDILNASRSNLYLSMRFLDLALSGLKYQMYLATRSVGTDGVSILYHPRYLVERYHDDPVLVNRVYLHMLFHCILRHMLKGSENEEETWNLACDIAVESMIDSLDSKAVKLVVSDYRHEIYDELNQQLPVLTAEGIYRVLQRKQYTYDEFVQMKREFTSCDHSIWERLRDQENEQKGSKQNLDSDQQEEQDSQEQVSQQKHTSGTEEFAQDKATKQQDPFSKQETKKQREQLNANWEKISEKTQTSVEVFGRDLGNGFDALTKIFRKENRPKYDYKQFLHKFAVKREVMKEDPEEFDYGYYTYGMSLYQNMPLIEPLEYREIKQIEEFVLVIDTSGSCSEKLVSSFLEESFQILSDQHTFSKKMNLYILQCDDEVRSAVKITNHKELHAYQENLTIKGRGGTDFRPAIAYIDELILKQEIKNLKGVLYFTDGLGIYPKKRPKYDVAFVFLGDVAEDCKVPSWAMKLEIETGE